MPFVETRLISPTTLTTSAASALYTVPTGYSAIIKQLVVTNITGTAATFTFYIGAASAGNALFSGTSVAANDTVIINLSQVLSTGEVLRALASTGSALNLTVSGVINDGPLASTATYIPDNAITVNKIADSSITTAKIAAGAVIDIDVNASAAIAQSKIANLTSDLALKAPLASPTFTGTVLTTNQPIIAGQIGSFTDPAADSLLQFDEFWVNRGITYNSSTRRFTVPTTGVYRISINPFFKTGVVNCRLFVGVDTDTPLQATHRGHAYRESGTYDTCSINSIVPMNAGSYVVFRLFQGALYNNTNDRFNQFSIELIG